MTTQSSKGKKKPAKRKPRASSELVEMRKQTKLLEEMKELLHNIWTGRRPE